MAAEQANNDENKYASIQKVAQMYPSFFRSGLGWTKMLATIAQNMSMTNENRQDVWPLKSVDH